MLTSLLTLFEPFHECERLKGPVLATVVRERAHMGKKGKLQGVTKSTNYWRAPTGGDGGSKVGVVCAVCGGGIHGVW